jgi:hypothetical protein
MDKIKLLIYYFFVFAFISCFSTPPKNKDPEVIIYMYTNPTTEYNEYEFIGLGTKIPFVSYSITNGVININTEKFQAIGTITDEKIVIDGKEFIRSEQ